MIPRIAAVGSAVVALFLLAACNTVQGAGEDIQTAGEEIQDASQEVGGSM